MVRIIILLDYLKSSLSLRPLSFFPPLVLTYKVGTIMCLGDKKENYWVVAEFIVVYTLQETWLFSTVKTVEKSIKNR